MRAWIILPTFMAMLWTAAASAQSDPVFHATAQGCELSTQTSSLGVVADQPVATCSAWSMEGARAEAGPGGLGVTAEHWHYCCATATGANATATVETEFFISGPPGNVTLSLNLAFSGTTGTTPGGITQVRLDVFVGSAWFIGVYNEQNDNGVIQYSQAGPLAPGPLTCSSGCNLTTPEVTLPTNTWIPLEMRLAGTAGGGTGTHESNVRAGDTLYFPIGSPVFNVPEGYTAQIPDMDVEDNQVVPEPGFGVLLGSGGIASAVVAQRRARRRT